MELAISDKRFSSLAQARRCHYLRAAGQARADISRRAGRNPQARGKVVNTTAATSAIITGTLRRSLTIP
jgi:hypothetical protein